MFIFYLFQGTKKEAEVVIGTTEIEITGQYGVTIPIADITDIELVDTMPAIGRKTNGAGLGEIRKGDFEVDGLGKCRLFLHAEAGPFIYIVTGEKYTIINFTDPAKTKSVYYALVDAAG